MKTKLLVAAAAATLVTAGPAAAAPFVVMHQFAGPDGQAPASAVITASDGHMYGVTPTGGDYGTLAAGGGTLYMLDHGIPAKTLHAFKAWEGTSPAGIVQGRDGFFYGTATYGGGFGITGAASGNGTLFRADKAGNVVVLHSFTGLNGSQPVAAPVQGPDGALYGVTSAGGGYQAGVVFRFDPASWTYTVLHEFTGADGSRPSASLIFGADGWLYGTTTAGGVYGLGTVFKVHPAAKFVSLHSFGGPDGSMPVASLLATSDGYVYGTTKWGGSGGGVVFRFDPLGAFGVVHRFTGPEGWMPLAGLTELEGNLYGTTSRGGQGFGNVFQLTRSGYLTVVETLAGSNGSIPAAPVSVAVNGHLWGTTTAGGTYGLGTVFCIEFDTAPQPPAAPGLAAITLTQPTVVGGSSTTGIVTLTRPAPASGAYVALSTPDRHLVTLPASVYVAPGSMSAAFEIKTRHVGRTETTSIVGTYGSTVSVQLTVVPK